MEYQYDIAAYDYDLPADRIAQVPISKRDASRLMVVDCGHDALRHLEFARLPELMRPNDLLVVNDTKVFPARLYGRKETGGRVELFLLEYPGAAPSATDGGGTSTHREPHMVGKERERVEIEVSGLLRSSKRPAVGSRLLFGEELEGQVVGILADGKCRVRLRYSGDLDAILERCGHMPLPPYIRRGEMENPLDRQRYQTLFAQRTGAVAAPTAGLHFSDSLLARIRAQGIGITSITLHVGYGTFAPVRTQDIRKHQIHEEYVSISQDTARLINEAKAMGGRVWTVGTTTARALESAADDAGCALPGEGLCGLFIYPGYRFKLVTHLITNFHLPRSSLLFLVSALAGRERILAAYNEAIRLNYRFYSYGDAMVIMARACGS